MSYESPINIIQDTVNEIVEMRDNTVYMKIREIVDVDKKELLKALAYDRDQYNKGYGDGYRRGLEEGKIMAMEALAESMHFPESAIDRVKRSIYGGDENDT